MGGGWLVECEGNNTDPLAMVTSQYPGSKMTLLSISLSPHIKLIIIFLAESLAPAEASQALCLLGTSGQATVTGFIRLEGDAKATQ